MYSGCNSNGNISAVELDPTTWQEIGAHVSVVAPDYKHRGFEVSGDNNQLLDTPPWVEGAWMNKLGGVYYLQYAVPGTDCKSYADGLFTARSPLGPFTLAKYAPFSHKPTGFAAGAGHSSTFFDAASINLWHIGTVTVSVRFMFERRLGLYPTHHDTALMQLSVDTYLGDYPQPLPSNTATSLPITGRVSGSPRVPQWMRLTYNKRATASSVRPVKSGDLPNQTFSPDRAFDEDIRTWWSAASSSTGEWISVDMSGPVTVHALQINFADQDCTIKGRRATPEDSYKYYVEYATKKSMGEALDHTSDVGDADGTVWVAIPELDLCNNTFDRPHNYVELTTPLLGVEKMRITSLHMPGGSKFSLSGFRAFGLGGGPKPGIVPAASVVVTREATDKRHVTVSWTAAVAAEFYIVRYGIAGSNNLFHNYQVYGDATTIDIRALIDDVVYEFAVDSVNSNGVELSNGVVKA
jgi:hypothetical protein